MPQETLTLLQAMKKTGLTEKELTYIRQRLKLVHTLALVSSDAMDEIKFLLEKKDKWKYNLKHDCKEIARLCKKASNQGNFFEKLPDEKTDKFIERLDNVERELYEFFEVPETTD